MSEETSLVTPEGFQVAAVRDKLLSARAYLLATVPYFSAAITSVAIYEATSDAEKAAIKGTAGVTARWNMYYNPDWLDTIEPAAVAGLFMHELRHLIDDDMEAARRYGENLNFRLWNIAADLVINPAVKDMKLTLPGEGIFPGVEGTEFAELNPTRGFYTREELYMWLMKNHTTLTLKTSGPGSGDCGSGATGEGFEADTSPNAAKEDDKDGNGRRGLSKVEADAVRAKVASDIIQHQQQRGDVPADLVRWAEGLFKSVVNWKAELGSRIRKTLDTWMTGSTKRTMAVCRERHGILQPTYRAKRPRLGFILDTSGSMSEEQVMQGVVETMSMAQRMRADVWFCVTDAAVHTLVRMRPGDAVKPEWVAGGGGTTLSLGFRALAELGLQFAATVVFTDGYTDWPNAADSALGEHIAVIMHGSAVGAPEFMRVIEVEQ